MLSQNIIFAFWDLSIEWNEKLTLGLILFSAGLLCIVSAILLAIYLLKSDRFMSPSPKESRPPLKRTETESRLSRFKKKIKSLFKRGETDLDKTLDELSNLKLKESPELPPDLTKDEHKSDD